MTKKKFTEILKEGRDRGRMFMVIKIESDGSPAPEIIINPSENFEAKMTYYNHAYNEDLELITAKLTGKTIRITDALMTNNLSDLNWFAY